MQAIYYRAIDGIEPVREFLLNLDGRVRDAIVWHIELLNELGERDPPLAFPYSSQVAGELRELRSHHGRRHFRVLYRRSESLFVLLHAFEKTSASVPRAAIAVAEARWEDFKTRMDAVPRRLPRAAGHDAP